MGCRAFAPVTTGSAYMPRQCLLSRVGSELNLINADMCVGNVPTNMTHVILLVRYFGFELHLSQNIPIGLIHTSYGVRTTL